MQSPGMDLRFVGQTLWRLVKMSWLTVTAAWFVVYAVTLTRAILADGALGGDAVLYSKAAGAWIHGESPWLTSIPWHPRVIPVFYLAPPPTLLPFLPFAWLPAQLSGAFWVLADAACAVYIIRRLHMSPGWLLFPPVVDCILVGNPELFMAALAICASGPLAGLAPVIKPYAAIALVGRRQWQALLVSATIVVVTFPLLQWDRFLGSFRWIQWVLTNQLVSGDLSAWGFVWQGVPILVPLAAISLLAYGKNAWWLAGPVLFPISQIHYAVLALPAMTPWLAIGFALPMPGARGLVVIAGAVVIVGVRLWKRRYALGAETAEGHGADAGSSSGADRSPADRSPADLSPGAA